MTLQRNLFADIPAELPEELFEVLLSGGVRIERIVSLGHASPPGFWYDQPQAEWVVLLRGAARVLFEGDEKAIELRPGDWLDIPARRRHRVEWTDPETPTVWLAVRYGDGERC